MGGSDARRGGGFFRGALTGLAVSALALAAWSLSAPPAPRTPAPALPARPGEPPQPAEAEARPLAEPAPLVAAPAGEPMADPEAQAVAERAQEPAAETPAPLRASEQTTVSDGQSAQTAAAAKPEPAAASAGEMTNGSATQIEQAAAERAPETPAQPSAEPPAGEAMAEADAQPAQAAAERAPEPAWRRNAEAFDARDAAPVAVALTGIDAARLTRALALGAPLTLAIDAAAPDASALIARARAAGREVVTLGVDADPRAVGVAAPGFDADALNLAREAGLLTLALTPDETTPADGAAAFRLDGDASAARVFQTLQEAARRAAPGDGVVVALAASDAALTGLARWLAVTDAAPAPFSAVAVSAGR